MLRDHPVAEDLVRFLERPPQGAASAKDSQLIRHLLADCAVCQQNLSTLGWDASRLDRLLCLPGTDENIVSTGSTCQYDYASAFAKSEKALEQFLAHDQASTQAAGELLAQLETLSAIDQVRRVETDPLFASPQLVRGLVERSHASRYEDAERMLHLASLARAASEACTATTVGSEGRLADLRTKAWGQYSNALRVSGRLNEAEEAMSKATSYCAQGTGDPPLRARLFEQEASLKIFQRHFDKAISLAEEAGQIYRDLGETQQLASTLVQKAIASLYSGEPESAAHLLNQAIPLIDYEEDPHLLLAACHNLVRCYIDLDRPEQGLSLYFQTKELYKEFKDSLILLRAAWQEGQLLRDLGHLRAAEAALLRARKGFLERDLAYEVAVVSLDLSSVYVRMGAVVELNQTVNETIPIFRALRVGREALASLLQLQQVADQEHQALELIRFLTSRLEHLSNRHLLK